MGIYDSQFWEEEESLLWEAMAGLYLSALLDGMEGGINALPPELQPLVNFDVLNSDALRFAKDYRYSLIRDITETTRNQVREAVTNWIQSGDPLSVLEAQLAPIFGSNRANMIAVTEVTRAFAEGNALAWQSTGFVSKVRFNTSRDDRVCPYCSPLAGEVFDVDDYGHKPPIHVRCRCFNTPVVDVDAVTAQVERVLNG